MIKRLLLVAVLIVTAWFIYEWVTFPNVAQLATEPPQTTSFMEIRRAELHREGKDETILYTWVPYGRISPYLRRAVLVAEDNEFYEHGGVDVKGMEEAIRRDWQKKRVTQGGSTITQQLAKNLYLSPSRNPFRKIKEYFLARALENHLTKKRILELYLNVVEMGERVYGAEAASRFYFNEHASALSPQQAALLAGCLPNPRVMVASEPNRRLRAREAMILSRMRRWGYLAEQEVLTAPQPEAAPPSQQTQTANTPTDTDLAPPPADTAATTATTATTSRAETTATESVQPSTTETSTSPPPSQSDTSATH